MRRDMISLKPKDLEMAEFYMNHLDTHTIWHISSKFHKQPREIYSVMRRYYRLKERKLKQEQLEKIIWDPHELDGEYNEDHDFRKLIKEIEN